MVDSITPDDLLAIVEQRRWLLFAAVVIGLVVRLLKSDTKFPITVPPYARSFLALFLGVVSGVLEKVATQHVSWTSAIVGGLLSAAFAMIGHATVIEGVRKGREFSIPGMMVVPEPEPIPPPPLPPAGPSVLPPDDEDKAA